MSKTKSGYFFLSFALLMVAVLTPVIMVTSMNDLSVKTSINLYKNRLQSRNFGLNQVDTKFEEFLAEHNNLLGLFESSLVRADVNDEADQELLYRFNSKSTLVPSNRNDALQGYASANDNRDLRGLFEFARVKFRPFLPNNGGGESGVFVDTEREASTERQRALDRAADDDGGGLNMQEGDLADPAHYYHILPAAGTGDASALECRYYDLNLNLFAKYPGVIPPTMDPLDNPCHFNQWQVGESIMIPLFDGEQKIILGNDDNANKMGLRLRLPCQDDQPYCMETERKTLAQDGGLVQVAMMDLKSDKVWVGLNNIRFESLRDLGNLQLTELGIVVNGEQIISNILINERVIQPALVLKLADDNRLFNNNNDRQRPFSGLEYQVVSNVPFADNKLIMTSSVASNSRLYELGNRSFSPEINLDLGVVFGN